MSEDTIWEKPLCGHAFVIITPIIFVGMQLLFGFYTTSSSDALIVMYVIGSLVLLAGLVGAIFVSRRTSDSMSRYVSLCICMYMYCVCMCECECVSECVRVCVIDYEGVFARVGMYVCVSVWKVSDCE